MWLDIVYAVLTPFCCAVAYRLRGHRLGPEGSFMAKNAVNRTIWAVFNVWALSVPLGAGLYLVPVFIGAWFAAVMGHRSYIGAGVERPRPIDGYRHEFMAPFLLTTWKDDLKIDLVGLAWIGGLRGLLVGFWYSNVVAGILVVGTAAGHVAGYYIANRLVSTNEANWIKRSEWLAGFLIGLGYSALTLV